MNTQKERTESTLNYYDKNFESFKKETENIRLTETQDMFLRNILPGGIILDFGCGTGKDSKYFLEKGYCVDAIDGCPKMVEEAKKVPGLNAKKMLFADFNEKSKYNGIWACASLLHCERKELDSVIEKILNALVLGGVAYMSFKYGTEERCEDSRWFTDFDEYSIEEVFFNKDVTILKKWVTNDARPERANERWLNILIRKRRKYEFV